MKKRTLVSKIWKYRHYYLLLFPGFFLLILFRIVPIGGLAIAFQDYTPSGGLFSSEFVGLKWFRSLFLERPDFVTSIWNTLILSLGKIIFSFPMPIFLSLLLNEVSNAHFKKAVQTVVYFPYFLSWVVISGIVISLLPACMPFLGAVGIDTSPLMDPKLFKPFMVVLTIWKETGWGTIVYLAAITGINPALYEAARIDGANRFQQAVFITVPCIASTIVVMLILRTGTIMSAGFDQVYNFINASVSESADIIDTYVYRNGIRNGMFSLATAAGMFQSVVGFVVVLITDRAAKLFGEDGLLG